ncbi:STAS domain-containing protein [Gracilibacillus kekensis]|uniref:Anti-anti-sigma regulatory factor (Antagonist of anti-sigma factor) n=1 Tax=Gracilibacillus kekensis TaxID=1027249 RepID=A0A1M7L225_9BACI|nr:STAS domain-containing protein [Gracilibacillus kekensis]SHM71863.1 Anti-anti-sigma regulatory factor (antagonist of anti-sigma factor) [Gracilibacillus kekensis]
MPEENHSKYTAHVLSQQSSNIANSIYNQHEHPHIYILIENLIYILSTNLNSVTNDEICNELKSSGFKNGNIRLDRDVFLKTLDLLPLVSQAIFNILKENAKKHTITYDEYYILSKKIDEMILHFNSGYVRGFMHIYQVETDKHLSDDLMELSVPIIKIDHHIGVCPLIGKIDAEKATNLMNKTIHNVVDKKIEFLIFDLTGIGSVEDSGLQLLFKAINSMKLVGTTIIFTGISSQIAMSSSLRNVNLSKIHVYPTVRDAVISLK